MQQVGLYKATARFSKGIEMKFIEMQVTGIVVDPSRLVPIVILKDAGQKNIVPIWIGIMEASAILTELENIRIERPMTHDLARNIIENMGGTVSCVKVTAIMDNVFYATISIINSSGRQIEIDSRPSDAIAIAMKCKVPVLVNEEVVSKARVVDLRTDNVKEMSQEELTMILESLSAKDFGKYKM